jgi:hypothetical protein
MKYWICLAFILICSCNSEPRIAINDTESEIDQDIRTEFALTAIDSIAPQFGEEETLLLNIGGVCWAPSGNIVVLDRALSCIREYNSNFELEFTYGGYGQGPQELQNPLSVACLSDSGIVVVDPFAGGVLALSRTEHYETLLEFHDSPPIDLIGDSNMGFIARKTERLRDDNEFHVRLSVVHYSTLNDTVRSYYEDVFLFDVNSIGSVMDRIFHSVYFTIDSDGRIYIAPVHNDRVSLSGYDTDGSIIFEIDEPRDVVQRTDEELLLEEQYMITYVNSINGDGFITGYNPDPLKPQIRALGIDSLNRIWIQLGTSDDVIFEVYSEYGEHLFDAFWQSPYEQDAHWLSTINNSGILIYPADPPDLPVIYNLALNLDSIP